MREQPETQSQKLGRLWHLHGPYWIRNSVIPFVLAVLIAATWLGLISGIKSIWKQAGHSQWWMGLSTATQHLLIGILLLAIGLVFLSLRTKRKKFTQGFLDFRSMVFELAFILGGAASIFEAFTSWPK